VWSELSGLVTGVPTAPAPTPEPVPAPSPPPDPIGPWAESVLSFLDAARVPPPALATLRPLPPLSAGGAPAERLAVLYDLAEALGLPPDEPADPGRLAEGLRQALADWAATALSRFRGVLTAVLFEREHLIDLGHYDRARVVRLADLPAEALAQVATGEPGGGHQVYQAVAPAGLPPGHPLADLVPAEELVPTLGGPRLLLGLWPPRPWYDLRRARDLTRAVVLAHREAEARARAAQEAARERQRQEEEARRLRPTLEQRLAALERQLVDWAEAEARRSR
jgi:hypothetical protein